MKRNLLQKYKKTSFFSSQLISAQGNIWIHECERLYRSISLRSITFSYSINSWHGKKTWEKERKNRLNGILNEWKSARMGLHGFVCMGYQFARHSHRVGVEYIFFPSNSINQSPRLPPTKIQWWKSFFSRVAYDDLSIGKGIFHRCFARLILCVESCWRIF